MFAESYHEARAATEGRPRRVSERLLGVRRQAAALQGGTQFKQRQ